MKPIRPKVHLYPPEINNDSQTSLFTPDNEVIPLSPLTLLLLHRAAVFKVLVMYRSVNETITNVFSSLYLVTTIPPRFHYK